MDEDRLTRSPSFQRLLDHRPNFSRPPIRCPSSPRLTEDEASMLTSPFLTYHTTYTYANSSIYDGDLPDYWEVPNLAENKNQLDIVSPIRFGALHASAPSIFYQLYLWICWILAVIYYCIRKVIVTTVYDGPRGLLVILYDVFYSIYRGGRAVTRSLFGGSQERVSHYTSLRHRTVSENEDSFWQRLLRLLYSIWTIATYPVHIVYNWLSYSAWSVVDSAPLVARNSVTAISQGLNSLASYSLILLQFIWETLTLPASLLYQLVSYMSDSATKNFARMIPSPARTLRPRNKRVSISQHQEVRTFNTNDSPSSVNDDDDSDEAIYTYQHRSAGTPSRGKRELYELRSRQITADTDTEDEGFSEKRPTRGMQSSSLRKSDGYGVRFEDNISKTRRTAIFLGKVASTIVAYFYWVLIMIITPITGLISAVKYILDFVGTKTMTILGMSQHVEEDEEYASTSSAGMAAAPAMDDLTPRTSRRVRRSTIAERHDTDETEESEQTSSTRGLAWVLYAPIGILLFLGSWIAGIFSTLFRSTANAFSLFKQWITSTVFSQTTGGNYTGENGSGAAWYAPILALFALFGNGILFILSAAIALLSVMANLIMDVATGIKEFLVVLGGFIGTSALRVFNKAGEAIAYPVRRPARLLWLVPLILLLLLLLFAGRKGHEKFGEEMTSLKDRASIMAGDVAESFSSEGFYPKSLTSIYDDYITTGQYSVYGLKDRIVGAIRSFFGYIWSGIMYIFHLVIGFIIGVWDIIITWFAAIGVRSYNMIPSITLANYIPDRSSLPSMPKIVLPTRDDLPNMPDVSFLTAYVPTKQGVAKTGTWFISLFSGLSLPNISWGSSEKVVVINTPSSPPPPPPSPKTESDHTQRSANVIVPAVVCPEPVDEAKLIKEITAKVHAAMDLQMKSADQSKLIHDITAKVQADMEQKMKTAVNEAKLTKDITAKVQADMDLKMNAVKQPTVDEAKMRQEITAQVQADMDLKMQSFEQSYKKIITELTGKQANIEIDYSQLEVLIRQAIYQYDADKTGLFDYALESAGASIISTRCSENFDSYSRLEKIWNIPLWYSRYGPRTVIQRNSNSLYPGECWSFKTGVGFLTIDLSHPINISSISYEHIGKHQTPEGHRHSAPKTFTFWAYQSENDFSTRFQLGSYSYDIDGHPLQFFLIKNHPNYPVKIVEMEIHSNYGSDFTCLYRLRVHGKIYSAP